MSRGRTRTRQGSSAKTAVNASAKSRTRPTGVRPGAAARFPYYSGSDQVPRHGSHIILGPTSCCARASPRALEEPSQGRNQSLFNEPGEDRNATGFQCKGSGQCFCQVADEAYRGPTRCPAPCSPQRLRRALQRSRPMPLPRAGERTRTRTVPFLFWVRPDAASVLPPAH
jgi:hypothetical protein